MGVYQKIAIVRDFAEAWEVFALHLYAVRHAEHPLIAYREACDKITQQPCASAEGELCPAHIKPIFFYIV